MGGDRCTAPPSVEDDEPGICASFSGWDVDFNGVLNGDLNGLFSGLVVSTFLRFFGGDGDGRNDSIT